ncbi:hypothetical protein [Streptacidiphilus jiangxiensis]|uniref:Uncharacterized protein n=1 Tax=Streptacidiphilus jiangxiensis TaxID=235985 RepID=A0A1H8B4M1_STRJI|nr:hypothetical protein [Streptacidiphilus jiangxiensis]SEM77693.1 hypothetical protein SAMN05414137_1577 [Streptacidiphilus jiangxiensis]
MDSEDFNATDSAQPEAWEYVEMTTPELADAIREGAVIYAEPTHDLRFEVSLAGVVQVVIAAISTEAATQLRHALCASLGGTAAAAVRTAVAIPLDEAVDRAQAALLLRAMDALAIVTGG